MRGLALALVACGGAPDAPSDDVTPPDLTAIDPERHVTAIFASLDASPASYFDVACGTVRRHAAPHRDVLDWQVTVSTDGQMAWAAGAGRHLAVVEVLERTPGGWMRMAGAVSQESCTPPPGDEERPATSGPDGPRIADVPRAPDAFLTACGGYDAADVGAERDTIWGPDADAALLASDADGDGVPDLIEATDTLHASADGRMAWAIGRAAQSRSLVVIERRLAGWRLVAGVWAPGPVAMKTCTQFPGERGRVIVHQTSIEVLDLIYFRKNSAAIQPESMPIADAIAATLKGNPDIREIAVQGHATHDETDPSGLSEARAMAIRGYLRDKGVAIDRLTAEFYGDAVPAIDIETGKLREPAENRRVTFLILRRAE
jgi:outer membrane protein OmpA-like peptidoglycan-associated protein